MKSVVADTHAALWFLEDDDRLSRPALTALDGVRQILLPTICLVEITYLIEKRRLDPAVMPRLLAELENPGTTLALADLDFGIVLALQDIPRCDVPDMPDRIIAATALHHRLPLVTCDRAIRSCTSVETIW
jgi:PIN domain nuclease of toxin-antitoxin system